MSGNNKGLSVAGFLMLATWLVLAQQNNAIAVPGPDAVIVVNSSSQPVPVSHQGPVTIAGDVAVNNLPAVQQVAGSVEVSNLPVVQQIAGEVTVSRPAVRFGHGFISFESGFPRSVEFPADVVVTDVVLDRAALSGDADVCDVWLFANEGGFFAPVAILRPSTTQRTVELHLQTGFGSDAGTTRGLFLNADCRIRFFWTGHTVE